MQLWIAGKSKSLNGTVWEMIGVFDLYDKAVAACTETNDWVAPITLNEVAPLETTVFPNAEYPLAFDPWTTRP